MRTAEMKRSIRLGNALVACCLLLGAANVAQAAPLVTGETLARYCVSNVRIAEGPVKGNVVEHRGLGCIGKRELDYSTLCEADVRAFGATGNGETDDPSPRALGLPLPPLESWHSCLTRAEDHKGSSKLYFRVVAGGVSVI